MTGSNAFTTVGRLHVADHHFLTVTTRTIKTPKGETVERVVIEHPGAVAIVALDGEDIILVKQYRAPADTEILEIPAGKLDVAGEDPTVTAARELEEETGFIPHDLSHLSTIWTTVGFSDERIGIYMASRVSPGIRTPVGDEEEASTVVRMPFAEAYDKVAAGEVTDAKSVAGILLAAIHRDAS